MPSRIELLHVDSHRLAYLIRFGEDAVEEGGTDPGPAMFGQQGDIRNPNLVCTAIEVKPP